ncbi:MAG TPA: 5'/3'-nucleotidase SurE [Polyangiaceae bacterium]|jgi:5'-nucleotidase
MSRPLVLVSNDDGYRSHGVQALREALERIAEVVVCAPEIEQSATSHSLSVHRPLRLFRREDRLFSVDGTPADCVYVALYGDRKVLPRAPDLVVSGVNHGVNLGDDVFYSGTIAAAREAALKGITSIAVSTSFNADTRVAAELATKLAELLLERNERRALLLNVNVPKPWNGAVRATRLGRRLYQDDVEFRRDPRGREYMWIGGAGYEHPPLAGSDTEAFDAGTATITPLSLDLWAPHEAAFVEELAPRLTRT